MSVEVLDVALEVLEVVGVINSATFLTALAIVLNALFVFDVEAMVGVLEDLSGSDLAASLIFLDVVLTPDILLSADLESSL